MYLTRVEHFNAAHRLFRSEYTDAENYRIFGKCSNPQWHGHNYTLYVTVNGELSAETGFVIDLKKLSVLIQDKVIEPLDHKNINLQVEFMKGKLASTENLAIGIWNEIEMEVANLGATLHCVKIEETENNIIEYFGK